MNREEIARILCKRRGIPIGSCSWEAYLADADAIIAVLIIPDEKAVEAAACVLQDALYEGSRASAKELARAALIAALTQ